MRDGLAASNSRPDGVDHARDSGRRHGLWNVAGRLAGAGGSLALVPLASRSLSGEEFGIWVILSSISAVLIFSDLGIANAMVTDMASAAAERDESAFRSLVTTGAGLLTVIGAVVVALGLVLSNVLDLNRLFGVSGPTSGPPTATATAVYLAVLGASLPLTVGPRILIAIQRSDAAARVAILATMLQVCLGGLVAASGGGLVAFAAVAAASGVMSGAAAWLVACRLYPAARPKAASIRGTAARHLLRRGSAYLTISVAGALGFETDTLVIAHALGPTRTAAYVVPARLFLLVAAVVTVYFIPLWPTVAHARSCGDAVWLRVRFQRALVTALAGSTAASFALALLARPAVGVLSPAVERPDFALIATLAALAVVHAASAPVAAFLSGLDLVRIQAVSAATMAVVNLISSIVLVRSLGVVGPPLATVVCQVTITLIPLTVMLFRRLRSVGGADLMDDTGRLG